VKTALGNAINADPTLYALFNGVDLTDAQAVADKLGTVSNEAAAAKAFADAVNTALGSAAATASGTTNSSKVAEIEVTGDGYYFIKDSGRSLIRIPLPASCCRLSAISLLPPRIPC